MASALTALPTITATALGTNTATAGGYIKTPAAPGIIGVVTGYTVPMDSLNFYVQHQPNPVGNSLFVLSTATGTHTTGNFTNNTVQRGNTVFVNTVSVGATCTLGINLLGVDSFGSGLATQVARASLDGIVASGMYAVIFYPGMAAGGGGPSQGTNFTQASGLMPITYQLQVSLTATASGGGANMTYTLTEQKAL